MTHLPGSRDSNTLDSIHSDPSAGDAHPSPWGHPDHEDAAETNESDSHRVSAADIGMGSDTLPRAVVDDDPDTDDLPKRGSETKKPSSGDRKLPARRGLSDNELAIMTILWREGETTGRSIAESFPHKVAYTTILTYLKRLEGKGYVSTVKAGRAHRFSASIPRREVVSDMLTRAVYALDADFPALLQFALDHGHVPANLAGKLKDTMK